MSTVRSLAFAAHHASHDDASPYKPYDFANRRHIGPAPEEMCAMLDALGVDSLDGLIEQTIPAGLRQREPLDFGPGMSEGDALTFVRETARRNRVLHSMLGLGYHGTVLPPAIQRNILENPAWYTAYTPYQPEISQGRLEALLNFQTLASDLSGLDVANASLLDEATAAAEAMGVAHRTSRNKADTFFVDRDCLPQTIAVVRTRAEPLGLKVVVGDPFNDLHPAQVFGALFQYPGINGEIHDFTAVIEQLHAHKALAVVAADPMALCLLKPPGEMGADIAVGSMQRFGMPMGAGGPHAAYIAVRDKLKRSLPGRLVGVSRDARGNRAYRLALQTREQHIRRQQATSNICTAQVLPAVIASMYAVFHGPQGLKAIARSIHKRAAVIAEGLEQIGFEVCPGAFFDTLTIKVDAYQGLIVRNARQEGINVRRIGRDRIGITVDETTRRPHIEGLWRAFGGSKVKVDAGPGLERLPDAMRRTSEYLAHPVFHMNRAEAEMTRYMRRLADRDLALDRAMIPLGSCTMKLNATAQMLPITWPEFAEIHPFAPADQREGYAELIEDLSSRLCTITGFDGVSMQPNSGAQGEYAGLLTIRAYHHGRGDDHRDVCLIPSSAHGTNPASAAMCGMKVVVVNTRRDGNIDVDDFREKAKAHSERLAAAMITYPSTHGVFEETIREVCDLVHEHGGQVYLDGANLNAMVGLARPGEFGADVCHLNLHKTFCIPHGGGGPGMGPIAVKAHLVPYLPDHPATRGRDATPGVTVSAAPYGSPAILPISWIYCLLMGGDGLTQATRVAILNANYIAQRLSSAYEILYRGRNGRVAHECIVDVRPLNEKAGITVDDIAKRLIDCGFHPPTMSWPVAGTFMIEPTESEPKAELDRFCDAMLAIAEEAAAIERGEIDRENNPLKNAPHTVEDLVGDWDRPYSRETACFPVGAFRIDKYWPPVNRVDNVWGDRNLVCACPPMEAYVSEAQEADAS